MLAVVAAFGGGAHAFRPRAEPRIVRLCSTAASWQLLLDCFTTHKLVATELGSLDTAKVLVVTVGDTTSVEGIAFYISGGVVGGTGPWHLGGLIQEHADRADFELLRVSHLGTYGYRFDLGITSATTSSLDGVTEVPAIDRRLVVAMCNGGSIYCTVVTPKCERIVHGQAIVMFDGALEIHGDRVSVTGFGSPAACSSNSEKSLR